MVTPDTSSDRLEHTITLTVDGDDIAVTLVEPGMLEKLRLSQRAPSEIELASPMSTRDLGTFIKDLVGEVSDFPPELINELPEDQFVQLVHSSGAVLRGDTPTVDNKDPKVVTDQYDPDDDDDDAFGLVEY